MKADVLIDELRQAFQEQQNVHMLALKAMMLKQMANERTANDETYCELCDIHFLADLAIEYCTLAFVNRRLQEWP